MGDLTEEIREIIHLTAIALDAALGRTRLKEDAKVPDFVIPGGCF
jgi:hypothetical protein